MLHGLAHPGIRAIKDLVCDRFIWPRMRHDIADWCRSCLHCQTAKIQQHNRAPVSKIPVPEGAFTHVNVDIVGP
jgi:hypothetical protein